MLDRSVASVGVYTRDESLGQNLMLTPLLCRLLRNGFIPSVVCPPRAMEFWKNPALRVSPIGTPDALPPGSPLLTTSKPAPSLSLTIPRCIQVVDEIQDVHSWKAIPGVTRTSRPVAPLVSDYLAHIYSRRAGYSRTSKYPALWCPIDDTTDLQAKQILAQLGVAPRSYVYLNISGRSNPTWCEVAPYIALTECLLQRRTPIILNSGPSEVPLIPEFTKVFKGYPGRVAVMPVDLPVWVVGAVMRQSRLVITKNSGIMQLADAVHTRTLAFTVREAGPRYWLAPRTYITLLETDNEPTSNTVAQVAKRLLDEPHPAAT